MRGSHHVVHCLMEWRLLASLTPADQRLVLARTHRHRYAKGETLFHEGDLAETVHLIQEGRVVARRSTPQGDVVTYAVMGPGEAFGEMAMLADDHRRSSTIVALEPVTTLTLRFDEFAQLCEAYPGVQALLVRMLAQRVDRLSTHLLDALYLPADRRVLRTLVDLSTQYGAGTGSAEVTLPLTQVDVAELSGSSRPTTNRYLRRLEERGLVRLNRGHITVVDVPALRAL
ncbi:MAG TPA: Crp/Fnr family transcriptional regulator [Lapillicoccus sp.]|nr:Crp/Fnr family transcriptional regulator [Lapillicoccus sp.]